MEAFFDSLVPSKADELIAAGDELSLREAAELEPGRADIAVALAKARLERGTDDEALEAVQGHENDFTAAGIAARIRLAKLGIGTDGFAALDRGEREAALDALLEELQQTRGNNWSAGGLSAEDLRDLLRRAVVGVLAELDQGDPIAREYRRRLSAALG